MASQDLNALTISGHVHSEPELHQFDDGDKAYTFVLAHTTDHHWLVEAQRTWVRRRSWCAATAPAPRTS